MITKDFCHNIFEILLKSSKFFSVIDSFYRKIGEEVSENNSGASYVSFEIILKSNDDKRELSITFTDYGDKKRVFVNIYNREEGSFSPLSLERFLKEACHDKSIHKLMVFQASTIQEIEEKIVLLFQAIETSQFNQIVKILKGEDWIDMPFDWHGYK